MAGFEVIVRPVVFPNIRPAPARALAPEDNPEQGIAAITGSGGRLIDLAHNWSVSVSRNRPQQETKRQFSKERVYQKDKQGKINRDNFIDVERLSKIRLDTEQGPIKVIYNDPPKVDNVEVIETDLTRGAS
jgi:hypothetical protein